MGRAGSVETGAEVVAAASAEDQITDRYHFIRPDSVVVVLDGVNSQGRCAHATGYRERAWSGVGVPYRRGDSLGGGHGVFVFPYPDHCCGPGCHELSQERSQRSSMPKYVPKPRAWVVHRLWLFKSADPRVRPAQ